MISSTHGAVHTAQPLALTPDAENQVRDAQAEPPERRAPLRPPARGLRVHPTANWQTLRPQRPDVFSPRHAVRSEQPILANSHRLCDETEDLLRGISPHSQPHLIATTSSIDRNATTAARNAVSTAFTLLNNAQRENDKHTTSGNAKALKTAQAALHSKIDKLNNAKLAERARAVANNLTLDIHLFFEESLQLAFESHPDFTRAVRDASDFIHNTLEIASIKAIDLNQADEPFKQRRIDTLTENLKTYFKNYGEFAQAGDWSDLATTAFLKQAAEKKKKENQVQPSDTAHKAVGEFKLMKMLHAQLPYFGGSVEYHQNAKESFEFWVYHLSTLTRDPDRQIPQSTLGGALPKPLLDYQTHRYSLLPLMNQRNLGTGITETAFNTLPAPLQEQISAGFRPVGGVTPAGIRKDAAIEKIKVAVGSDAANAGMEAIWNAAKEDQKKVIYGDICQLPWSSAHLHGGTGFEQAFDSSANVTDLNEKHPERPEPGLMNVVGVAGNILETPEVAGEKYLAALTARFGTPEKDRLLLPTGAEGPLLRVNPAKLLDDFKARHQSWYDSAMANQKPIIGGVSGHTLGYMNLYLSALALARPEDRAELPDLETFRAIMMAGLIGNKRHHSYDEVMVASVGIGTGPSELRSKNVGGEDVLFVAGKTRETDQELAMPHRKAVAPMMMYTDREGYGDVLASKNKLISQCVKEARKRTKNEYLTTEHTVAAVLARHLPDGTDHENIRTAAKAYAGTLLDVGDVREAVHTSVKTALLHQAERA